MVMLIAATLGLAVSMCVLTLILTPAESLQNVLTNILRSGFPSNLPLGLLLSSLLFLCTVLACVVGVIYFLVLPEMKNYVSGSGKEAASIVLRSLKPEERTVVGVLDAHGGVYLQKYVSRESGLSRLKTHRVVAALSERGVVHVEKNGNTNEITLVEWFREGMHQ